LRALVRVLLELDVHAVRIFAPTLPTLVATQLFCSHFDAGFFQFFRDGINIVHFKAKVVDALAAKFGFGINLEKFDELAGRDLEIKAEELSVFEKIKMRFEAERVAIKVAGAREVFGEDAEMGKGFNHTETSEKLF
jgi:hypothetical protein